MTRRTILIDRESALFIAKTLAVVPVPKRRAVVKGLAAGLRGVRRPDRDTIATALWTQLRLVGVIPHAKRHGSPFTYRGSAA